MPPSPREEKHGAGVLPSVPSVVLATRTNLKLGIAKRRCDGTLAALVPSHAYSQNPKSIV